MKQAAEDTHNGTASERGVPIYNYDSLTRDKYREFVAQCACYNTRTATDILVQRRCRLSSAKRVCSMISEFMEERRRVECPDGTVITDERVSTTLLLANDHTRAVILLDFASQLPSYARFCGGMIICALSEYMTAEQWNEQLEYVSNAQSDQLLWTESFIRAGLILSEGVIPAQNRNQFIEAEAEKIPVIISCMRHNEYVEVTFID